MNAPSPPTAERLFKMLNPYLSEGYEGSTGIEPLPLLYDRLSRYLELLLKWNGKTNLTAIREPDEIVRRHFGESLFAGCHLDPGIGKKVKTLLDFGSGAGFPGLPIQLLRPDIEVTLAESQNKKAAFLREAVRTLGLKTEVWAGRVEAMPAFRKFDVVALRAVDDMSVALEAALPRTTCGLLLLTTANHKLDLLPGFALAPGIPVPGSMQRELVFARRL